MKRIPFSLLFLSGLFIGSPAMAGRLVVNSMQSNPVPKQAWIELVEHFKAENPDIEVEFNTYDSESYKTTIRNWLTSEAPDIVHWFAGERLNTFVSRNLLEDVSDVWDESDLGADFASSRAAVTFDGKEYAVPYGYYHWAVYYRKDLFEQFGLSEPETWDAFLHVCEVLKQNNITPITIGTKYLWTAAGWFDYLNLRINGIDFHRELMPGRVPYTDQRVRKVFEKWGELVAQDYFLPHHTSYSWQEALPPLFRGQAAMFLIGNFFTQTIPPVDADKYDSFRFPIIDPDLPIYEERALDVVAIPAIAKNKADARKFLAFVARPDVQSALNIKVGNLPPNIQAEISTDRFLMEGAASLSAAAATSQFYDRDTPPEMAKVGMKGFQEFMDRPERLDRILEQIEKTRSRVFR